MVHIWCAEPVGAVCTTLLQIGPALVALPVAYPMAVSNFSDLAVSRSASILTRPVPRTAEVVKTLTPREATMAVQAGHKLRRIRSQGSRAADR